MSIRNLFLTLWMAGTLAAQSFIQMSHPQFGMYTKNANFEHETVNFEFAIANANRLKPAFVVITGDLINDAKSAAQAAEYKRISAKLDTKIRLYRVAGNRDGERADEGVARPLPRASPPSTPRRRGWRRPAGCTPPRASDHRVALTLWARRANDVRGSAPRRSGRRERPCRVTEPKVSVPRYLSEFPHNLPTIIA
jgi:hypothetical protein